MDDALTNPVCCECGGPLDIVERDASFLVVVCPDCGSSHGMEVTTAPDGTPTYWPAFRIALTGDARTL